VEGEELRLDGNAIAGTLGEVFVDEMTSARIACEACGSVESVGAAPGIVLRCTHCDSALLVMTRTGSRMRIWFPRSRWLETGEPGND
jgi:DNA-directed RNA polymerase subunit RPC12/RpoP